MYNSPCVNICKIDPHTECCIGCNRYIEEIEVWQTLTDLSRQDILRQLKDRGNEKAKEK